VNTATTAPPITTISSTVQNASCVEEAMVAATTTILAHVAPFRRKSLAPRRPALFEEQYALALLTAIVLIGSIVAVCWCWLVRDICYDEPVRWRLSLLDRSATLGIRKLTD